MEIFVESPWPAVFFGVVGEAILAVALVRSGRGALLWAMAGVLAVSLAGVAVARLVVTEKKLAAAVIYDRRCRREERRPGHFAAHLSRGRGVAGGDRRRHAAGRDQRGKDSRLDIAINRLTSPPTATATFNFIGTGKDRRGEFGQMTRPGKAIVQMPRQPGGWVIVGHKFLEDPR